MTTRQPFYPEKGIGGGFDIPSKGGIGPIGKFQFYITRSVKKNRAVLFSALPIPAFCFRLRALACKIMLGSQRRRIAERCTNGDIYMNFVKAGLLFYAIHIIG